MPGRRRRMGSPADLRLNRARVFTRSARIFTRSEIAIAGRGGVNRSSPPELSAAFCLQLIVRLPKSAATKAKQIDVKVA